MSAHVCVLCGGADGLVLDSDIVTMYDTAWRQQPSNEELAIHTFSANARTGNWKAAQQVRVVVTHASHGQLMLLRLQQGCTNNSKKTASFTGACFVLFSR